MKHIKEYIIEGLFDDEDDLMNKKPSTASLNWFLDEQNATFPDKNPDRLYINDKGLLSIKNNILTPLYINLNNPIPDWIELDRRTFKASIFNLMYPIKNQDDIPDSGSIQYIKDSSLKNLIIDVSTFKIAPVVFNKCKIVGPIDISQTIYNTEDPYITFRDTPLDLKNILYIKSISSDYAHLNIIASKGSAKKIFNDISKNQIRRQEFIDQNQSLLRQLRGNGICEIYSNDKLSLHIDQHLGDGKFVIIPEKISPVKKRDILLGSLVPFELR